MSWLTESRNSAVGSINDSYDSTTVRLAVGVIYDGEKPRALSLPTCALNRHSSSCKNAVPKTAKTIRDNAAHTAFQSTESIGTDCIDALKCTMRLRNV